MLKTVQEIYWNKPHTQQQQQQQQQQQTVTTLDTTVLHCNTAVFYAAIMLQVQFLAA
jgi:hypothetical protein